MRGLFRWRVAILGCLILQVRAQTPVINFDAPIATFDRPAGLIIYASNMPATHTYFILPNTVEIRNRKDGTPSLNVVWFGIGKKDAAGSGGDLTVTVQPSYGALPAAIMQYVQSIDPAAVVVNSVPVTSEIISLLPPDYTVLPGVATWDMQSSSPLGTAVSIQLKPLGVRALSLRNTSGSDLLLLRYRFRVREVEANVSNNVIERDFQFGLSTSVSCVQALVTKQSGKRKTVGMRQACSPRLRNAVFHWATSSLCCDSRNRKHYDALRAAGHLHARALRGLADRLLGVLIALLKTQKTFDRARRDGTFAKNSLVVASV